jgi:hypothetical protein
MSFDPKKIFIVIPAKAWIQGHRTLPSLGSRSRGDDGNNQV